MAQGLPILLALSFHVGTSCEGTAPIPETQVNGRPKDANALAIDGRFTSDAAPFQIGKVAGWTWKPTVPVEHLLIGIEKEFEGFGRVRIIVRAWTTTFLPEPFFKEKLEPFFEKSWEMPKMMTEPAEPIAGIKAFKVLFLCMKSLWPSYGEYFGFRHRDRFFEYRGESPRSPDAAVRAELNAIRGSISIDGR